jgi:hypothetical protein
MAALTHVSTFGRRSMIAVGLLLASFVAGASFGMWTEAPARLEPHDARAAPAPAPRAEQEQEIEVEYDVGRFSECQARGGVVVIPFDRAQGQHKAQTPACVAPSALEPFKKVDEAP